VKVHKCALLYLDFVLVRPDDGCIATETCRRSEYRECPTRYRTRHFFNNFTTNEDIATKFETDLRHCVRNVKENSVLLFKFRCNIFIGVRIIKEMLGSVASGTTCIKINICRTIILPDVLYGCETWSLTLWKQHRQGVFENRVLRKMPVV
jgi:hypothetical protein